MANPDAPFGLAPVQSQGGLPFNGTGTSLYYCPTTDGTALGIGDPVIKAGDANANPVLGFPASILPSIAKATAGAGNKITGSIVGFLAVTQDSLPYRAASTERVAIVADSPLLIFEVECDGGRAITTADIGQNADLTFATALNTTTGVSGVKLDTSTIGTGATKQVKILSLSSNVNNAIGLNAVVKVMINNHTDANAVVGF